MNENKQEICNHLCEALKLCRAGSDLKSLEYDPIRETVFATFEGYTARANVAMDSGVSMIRDIMRQIF